MSRSSERLLRRLRRSERGQELVELALILPILLFILLGTMELGHAFGVAHAMTGLSREGASLAARGATLAQVAQVVIDNGTDIEMNTLGGVIASRVVVQGGAPTVTDQFAQGGAGSSRLGALGGTALSLQGLAGLQEGRVLYVVEVFHAYDPITPLDRVLGPIIPASFYEAAIF